MVNHLYILHDIAAYHEQYATRVTIACSSEVRDLGHHARKQLKGDAVK